MISLALEAV